MHYYWWDYVCLVNSGNEAEQESTVALEVASHSSFSRVTFSEGRVTFHVTFSEGRVFFSCQLLKATPII